MMQAFSLQLHFVIPPRGGAPGWYKTDLRSVQTNIPACPDGRFPGDYLPHQAGPLDYNLEPFWQTNGLPSYQPGATPRRSCHKTNCRLKACFIPLTTYGARCFEQLTRREWPPATASRSLKIV